MTDALPTESDTPPGHVVIALRVEAALLPDWYEAIIGVASPLCRRLAVMEKPEEWVLRVELPEHNVPAFKQGLAEAWEGFVARRRAEGNWERGE